LESIKTDHHIKMLLLHGNFETS